MQKPIWLRRFAVESGMNLEKCEFKVDYDSRKIPPDNNLGVQGGWELSGLANYTVQDGETAWLIAVKRLPRKKNPGTNAS